MPNTVMRRLVAAAMLMPMAAAIALPLAAAGPAAPLAIEGGAIAIPAPASGVLVFHGLPYAAPPVGDRRWRAPAPLVPWQGVRPTDSFSPDCMQPENDGSPASRPKSEDCLYLNVWTTGLAGKRPVFVWIHGGGSRTGSGAQPTFDGTSLARRGIVVVTINYRLGALGFLSTPGLSAESGYGGSGNYGFMDDIAALQWVRRNIARFGGDPARVTIGGESSGAVTTGALMASPLARGLFRGVIGESGSVFRVRGGGSQGATSLASEEAKGAKLMQALGAADMAAMRALPPQRIMEGTAKLSLAEFFNLPVVDGHVLPRAPWQVFARHQHNDVPLLVGWNSGEGSMELIYLGTLGTLPERMERYYGPLAAQARRWYPAPSDTDMPTLLRASGDYGFAYPEWRWALAAQRFGRAPVFIYQFDHAPPIPADQFGGRIDARLAGAYHGSELAYVFDTLGAQKRWAITDTDRRIARQMSGMWARFILSGSPNGPGLPAWPRYDPAKGPMRMAIGAHSAALRDPDYAKFQALRAIHDKVDPAEPTGPAGH